MAWRFRRRLPLLRGLTVNLGKGGITSVSLGVRGAHLTIGRRGRRATFGLPGSGLSYSVYERYHQAPAPARSSRLGLLLVILIIAAIAAVVLNSSP